MPSNLTYNLTCADCGKSSTFTGRTVRSLCENARDKGWAINRDNTQQWCPKCAVNHRRGNASNK